MTAPGPAAAGDVVWSPRREDEGGSGLAAYERWLRDRRGLAFKDYRSLWRWSVDDLEAFWSSIWAFEDVRADGDPGRVLAGAAMPGATWFPDVRLNYAEHLLRRADPARPALLAVGEDGASRAMSWAELRSRAGALAAHLRTLGVGPGDRVAGYLGIGFEAVVGLVATASLGAVWSVCAPDFGVLGVRSRFAQLEPKVLLATAGYTFGGRAYDRRAEVAQLVAELPSVGHVVWAGGAGPPLPDLPVAASTWSQATAAEAELTFARVPFDHPLWALFSSGTTGTPKGIVHGHGGILLEHLKNLRLHMDVREGDRYMYVGSTSWMVFNLLVSGLLLGATVVLLEGSPVWPDLGAVWRVAAEQRLQIVGVGAGYVQACLKAQLSPAAELDLGALRQVSVTGSPLSPAGFTWLREHVGQDVWPSSASGGTDVCSGFVGGCPALPVRAGRLQAPSLGVAVEAWDRDGRPVVGEVGELVVRRPMPSMPVTLWGDADGQRMRDTYFSTWPGVWRHGDYIAFDEDLSSVISGRSDSTLNRNGIRIGPAELYAAVETLPEVREAMVVGAELGDEYYMPLFVDLADDADADAARAAIVAAIRGRLSPRHVPDAIVPMPAIPHTRTGKKLEVPVKRLLQGEALADVVDRGSVDDPELLEAYARFAAAAGGGAALRGAR